MSPGDAADILVVCTGNIARSPLAEALLREEARRRAGRQAPVQVSSAGVHGLEGRGAVAEMCEEAASRGLDLSRHRGARATAQRIRDADLVLAMTVAQRRRLVGLVPAAEERTFTLRELARLLSAVEEPDGDLPVGERVRTVAHRAHRARARARPPDGPEDVRDPYGGARAGYREVAAEIERLVGAVAPALFGGGTGDGRLRSAGVRGQ